MNIILGNRLPALGFIKTRPDYASRLYLLA